jgi:hypothetical protein
VFLVCESVYKYVSITDLLVLVLTRGVAFDAVSLVFESEGKEDSCPGTLFAGVSEFRIWVVRHSV